MAAVYGIGQAIIFLSCGFFFYLLLSSFFFTRPFSAVADWISTILLHMGGLYVFFYTFLFAAPFTFLTFFVFTAFLIFKKLKNGIHILQNNKVA